MDSQHQPVVVGYTLDDKPWVFVGVGNERSFLSLSETSRLANNLKGVVRKLRRASWKEATDV